MIEPRIDDLLEHVDDPLTFIDDSLRPVAAPRTAVLVGVPAHPLLFSDHDRALGHFRRYRPGELLAQVRGWIDVVEHGPLFASLVAPRAASVAVERIRSRAAAGAAADTVDTHDHGAGDWQGGPTLTRAVAGVLAADAAATRRLGGVGRRLPGLSHWVFGRVR